jgi:hypothetical protein
MRKSLYYKIDRQIVTQVLRWLNGPSARSRGIGSSNGAEKWATTLKYLSETDPHLTIEDLVESLNFVDRSSEWLPRQKRRQFGSWINKSLESCLVFPQIRSLGDRKRAVFFSSRPSTSRKIRAYRETISKVLYLHVRGLLSTVRKCSFARCGKWFHAMHGKSLYHSNRCRNRDHYANLPPKSKERRRELARLSQAVSRANRKIDDLKALAAVNPKYRAELEQAKKEREELRSLKTSAEKRLALKGRR